jgi:hypothetical protein
MRRHHISQAEEKEKKSFGGNFGDVGNQQASSVLTLKFSRFFFLAVSSA